jgi:hypothetical protein
MSYHKLAAVGLVVLALIVGACGPQTLPETGGNATTSPLQPTVAPTAGSDTGDLATYDDLAEALRAAGATVEPGDELEELFPGIPNRVLKVNGMDVQVFEFPDEDAAAAAASTIEANGYIVGTMQLEWIEQPNFWTSGRLIALYIGQDRETIDLLTGVMGEPLTGSDMWGEPADPDAAVQAAINSLSETAGAAASEIEVVSLQAMDWPDACLGLPEAGEACATVITPGFKIVLSVDGKQYEFHTDATGTNVRFQEL